MAVRFFTRTALILTLAVVFDSSEGTSPWLSKATMPTSMNFLRPCPINEMSPLSLPTVNSLLSNLVR